MVQAGRNLAQWLGKNDQLVFPIGAALVARIFLSVFGAFIAATSPGDPPFEFYNGAFVPLAPVGLDALIAPFQRWDAVWYDIIASRGYAVTDQSAAFFPLLPLLMRVLALGTGATFLVGTLVSTAATAGTFALVYRNTQELFDRTTARLAIVSWAVFPTAFYLFIPYAEALLLLLSVVSLEAARRNRWVAAGILGGLAALTRPPGVWLLVPLAVVWLEQARAQSNLTRVRTALPLLLVPLGILLHMLYLQLAFGDALLWLHALAAWENRFSFPWDTVAVQLNEILFGNPGTLLNNLLDLGATIFALGMVIVGLLPQAWRTLSLRGWKPRLPLAYGIYGLVFLLVPLTVVGHGFGMEHLPMANAARRAVVIFPAFMMAGVLLQGRLRAPLWISLSLGFQCIFVYIFVRWLWVD